MKKIEIVTRLHSGIYKSSGGGQEVVRATYNLGPRNLLAAVREAGEIRRQNVESFGNVGCGSTWLRIDGQDVAWDDLEPVDQLDMRDARKIADRYGDPVKLA